MIRQVEWWQDIREIHLFAGYQRAVRQVDMAASIEKLGQLLLEDFRRFIDGRALLDVILTDQEPDPPNPHIEADTADQASRASIVIRARAEHVRRSWRWVVLK